HIRNGCATTGLHHATVLIFKYRNTDRAHSLKQGASGRARVWPRLDEHRYTGSAIFWIRWPMPVFDPAIDVQNRFVAPRWISSFRCKEIPVAFVTARPDHRVDAGSATQALSHP